MPDRIEQLSQSTFLTASARYGPGLIFSEEVWTGERGKFLGKDLLDKFIHCLIFVVDDPSESIVKGFHRFALTQFFKGHAKSRTFHA